MALKGCNRNTYSSLSEAKIFKVKSVDDNAVPLLSIPSNNGHIQTYDQGHLSSNRYSNPMKSVEM